MVDSLKYLRKHHPEVFERTKYRIIEISPQLARRQRARAKRAGLEDHVEIVESDFFKWEGGGSEPCYVVALEVLVRRTARHEGWADSRTISPMT